MADLVLQDGYDGNNRGLDLSFVMASSGGDRVPSGGNAYPVFLVVQNDGVNAVDVTLAGPSSSSTPVSVAAGSRGLFQVRLNSLNDPVDISYSDTACVKVGAAKFYN